MEAGTPPAQGWCLLDRWDVYWGPWVARVCTSVSVGGPEGEFFCLNQSLQACLSLSVAHCVSFSFPPSLMCLSIVRGPGSRFGRAHPHLGPNTHCRIVPGSGGEMGLLRGEPREWAREERGGQKDEDGLGCGLGHGRGLGEYGWGGG